MAVYNGERYVREAIESILAQTFQDFEFLIINDGSVDSSREVILSYNDPRIRLVENECNLGLTKSLNRGLRMARGQLVARQDADDVSEPERLAKQVAYMELHPEVALLGTGYKEIDEQGIVLGKGSLPCDDTDIRWCLLFFCPFVHSSVMLRTSTVLEQIGLYNESYVYSQDFELWCRIARRLRVANLEDDLLQYRINGLSMTATYGDRVQEGYDLRFTMMGRLLGWKDSQSTSHQRQFRKLAAFYLGNLHDYNSQEITETSQELLKLHAAFCKDYQVDNTECVKHRSKVRHHMSEQIMQVAHHRFNNDSYLDALRLLIRACLLHWTIVFTRSSIRLMVKLLLRPSAIRILKNAIQKRQDRSWIRGAGFLSLTVMCILWRRRK